MTSSLLPSRRSFCLSVAASTVAGAVSQADGKPRDSTELAKRILSDPQLRDVKMRAGALLASGLRAGSGYPEVWIRDTNTFIETALGVCDHAVVRSALLNFLELQGPKGDIVDGFVPVGKSQEPPYRTSPRLPEYVAFKNTVESDQESSLVSAFRKYVDATGDHSILDVAVSGKPVRARLSFALEYVLTERWSQELGLVWGGTTVDWGDVQPEDFPATHLDKNSHRACSIYANAMLAIALQDLIALTSGQSQVSSHWATTRQVLCKNIRKKLWDNARQKFIPHLYLNGSPFPPELDEAAIYYHGGTAIAIEAGLLSRDEVQASLETMRTNVRAAGAGSIGLTIYPTYPAGIFKDPILRKPYTYQNGGDWCWFGARMVQQLVRLDFIEDGYRELQPMVARILKAGDFYEWWSRQNEPRGSGAFRGGAGVMAKAIAMLQLWAKQHAQA